MGRLSRKNASCQKPPTSLRTIARFSLIRHGLRRATFPKGKAIGGGVWAKSAAQFKNEHPNSFPPRSIAPAVGG